MYASELERRTLFRLGPPGDPRMTPPELVLTHVVDAPHDRVWAAWTEPARIVQWWGPHGFTIPEFEADLRAGGTIRYAMRGPDGDLYPSSGTFEVVESPHRIVTFVFVKIDDAIVFNARTDVRFAGEGEKTRVDVTQTYENATPAAAEPIRLAPIGWAQQFERLEAFLAASKD